MTRCKWCNLNNPIYIKYHDEEWGKEQYDDDYLFEMLILESFQAGLSWECVLNKREAFRLKIIASINNAKIFKQIKNEYGSFYNYLKQFTNGNRYIEVDQVSSELSDKISEDLVKRKMKFVGTKIIYSFLQAIGIIYSHDKECYLYKESITNE